MTLLNKLNQEYMSVHKQKEDAFWSMKMALRDYQSGSFETAETNYINFIGDSSPLQDIRSELERPDLGGDEEIGLRGWLKFFECNAVEDPAARKIQSELINLEGELFRKRQDLELGYDDPETGNWVGAGYGKLSLLVATSENSKLREAAWKGMGKIEPYVLANGFIEIVKKRNALARLLGYQDYYDYKVSLNEGFSKEKLFEILDELAESTADAQQKYVKSVVSEHGLTALKAWNFSFLTSGDVAKQLDPYFPFEESLTRWGQSFAALGIDYNGAEMRLDLVNRKGKFENGFMHGPTPGFVNNGHYESAAINFTANAIPGQLGSGVNATATLFHEGGHAAHFANIKMPAPCFAQEFAPTSVAFAETQSMFLDSLIEDPDWLMRYAKTVDGKGIPQELLKKKIEISHKKGPGLLRQMLAVCYTEKAIYEMKDTEISAERILAAARESEKNMSFLETGPRPTLSIPHLISGEASAYYHGYILAQMGVNQTRSYFIKKYGHIMDNPKIGPELKAFYWKEGNDKNFLEFIKAMTGEEFSAKSTAELVNQSIDECLEDMEKSITRVEQRPPINHEIELNANISMVHGDQVIASSAQGGFANMASIYGRWVSDMSEKS